MKRLSGPLFFGAGQDLNQDFKLALTEIQAMDSMLGTDGYQGKSAIFVLGPSVI